MKIVNQSYRKKDAMQLVTGQPVYTDDLVPNDCLLVKVLGGNPVETAQLYSKEIENDPDNVDCILDGAYTNPALTDANLLGLLLK